MIDTGTTQRYLSERDLRHQIDRSVSRALYDHDFAGRLLTSPALVLEDRGCSPQQLRSLLSIRANDLTDFALQARRLFWLGERVSGAVDQPLPLAAGAHS